MHSEIIKMIEEAIADGVVTEEEKTAIIKKAEELGIRREEVEMEIDKHLKV